MKLGDRAPIGIGQAQEEEWGSPELGVGIRCCALRPQT